MKVSLSRRARLGTFDFDLKAGELRHDEQTVSLQEQPAQVLRMLVAAGGDLVTRQEIQKRLWPNDTVVEFDHGINTAIQKLRQALGDSADAPRYIETVGRRRGYRLLVSVKWVQVDVDNVPNRALAEESPTSLILIGRKVSHYRVLEVIGGGGMGLVYKAEDLKLGRRVALKFLPEEMLLDAVALQRFEREAQTASALNHPNICTIHGIDEYEGQPFIVMELLEGETLRDRLAAASTRALLPNQLLRIALQICDGLEAAHKRGIIHRDIKPANVFLTTSGQVKILDFGLAKLVTVSEETGGEGLQITPVDTNGVAPAPAKPVRRDATITRLGSAMGTAGYMSPEQMRGETLDARTDLFSFGLVLYEMATGQRAFQGDTAEIVREAILQQAQVPVHDLNPELSPRLEAVIDKALAKSREQRYQTAAELGGDLQHFKSDTISHRAGAKGVAGHHWPLWVSGSLVTLLGALAIAWLLWRRVAPSPELVERQVTANPLEDRVTGGAISPDGKHVAYHDQTGLYLRAIDSDETHAIAVPAALRSRIFGLCWFAGGTKLLAEVASADGYDIWVITVLGETEPRLLFRHAAEPAVSPDGRMVAFTNYEFGKIQQEVWVGGLNGEAPRKLVDAREFQNVFNPVWSPDGREIAYARRWQTAQGSWNAALEVRPASGGPAKTLVAETSLPKPNTFSLGKEPFFTEAWAPDWRFVFSVAEGGEYLPQTKFSLWEVQVEPRTGEAAGNPQRLTQWSEFGPTYLTITPDGKRLSLVKSRTWGDVYLGEPGPGGTSLKAPRRLTLDDRGSILSAWTRDGQAVVFESLRNGRREIFRQSPNENVAEAIVAGPADVYDGEFSPDGFWLLYWESESKRGSGGTFSDSVRLMRQPAVGGAPETVLEWSDTQAGTLYGFHCSSNPKASSPCVLGVMEGKDLVFYSVDLSRGKGAQLGKIEVTQPSRYVGWGVATDASHLALVDQDKYKEAIEVLTLSDGTWHEVPIETSGETLTSIAWAADGESFFVTSRTPDSFDLLHVTGTGKVQPLLRNGRRLSPSVPLPSPDGKQLAFQGQTWSSNIWMVDSV